MNQATKQELEVWVSLYVTAKGAYIPLLNDTDAGFHLENEPVISFNCADVTAMERALAQSLANGNPVIAAPKDLCERESVIAKYIGASSQAELERVSIHFSIEQLTNSYVVQCSKRASSGLWDRGKEKALDVSLPKNCGTEQLVRVILEHLRTRNDLPGSMVDFNQPKTARGA